MPFVGEAGFLLQQAFLLLIRVLTLVAGSPMQFELVFPVSYTHLTLPTTPYV